MTKRLPIKALFVDIGGVFLTNGWDHDARQKAAITFKLNAMELDERHRIAFDAYEEGKLTLDEYLDMTVFYVKRPFTRKAFIRFMFAQTKELPGMIDFVTRLKAKYKLKVAVVSNEGRELNAYRITKFKITDFVDFFVSSGYVGMRKPDPGMFHLALDLIQVDPAQVAYLEDRQIFVDVAAKFGIKGVQHSDLASTKKKFAALGLRA